MESPPWRERDDLEENGVTVAELPLSGLVSVYHYFSFPNYL